MSQSDANDRGDRRTQCQYDLIPIGALVVMLALSVYLFSDSSSSGPNQIVLTLGAAIAGARFVVSESGDILSPK